MGPGPSTPTWSPAPSVLETVLQHVPLQHRLSSCALVCRAWADAATAATTRLKLDVTARHSSAFEAWLEQHAGQLQIADLTQVPRVGDRRIRLQLPCAKLTQLHSLQLSMLEVQLATAAAAPHSLHPATTAAAWKPAASKATAAAIPSLRELDMYGCHVSTMQGLLQLAAAPCLTKLRLGAVDALDLSSYRDSMRQAVQRRDDAMARLLQQVPALRVLELVQWDMCAATLQAISSMQHLQHLTVKLHCHKITRDAAWVLPSGITQLDMHAPNCGSHNFDGHFPGCLSSLPMLTQLVELRLFLCAVDPAALSSLTSLQRLSIELCQLLPLDTHDGEDEPEHYPPLDATGTAALLCVLPALQRLRSLVLRLPRLDVLGADAEQFTALLAAPELSSLVVLSYNRQPMPRCAASFMFRDCRPLPRLQHLTLAMDFGEDELDPDDELCTLWSLTDANLASIIRCCPALRSLDVHGAVTPSPSCALQQLPTTCTSLGIGGEAYTNAKVPVVAALTHLKALEWSDSPDLTDVGVERLTRLKNLEHLMLDNCGLSRELFGNDDGDICIILHSSDSKGPVWRQLGHHCDGSIACAPHRLKRLRKQHERLQARMQVLQQRLVEAGLPDGAAGEAKSSGGCGSDDDGGSIGSDDLLERTIAAEGSPRDDSDSGLLESLSGDGGPSFDSEDDPEAWEDRADEAAVFGEWALLDHDDDEDEDVPDDDDDDDW